MPYPRVAPQDCALRPLSRVRPVLIAQGLCFHCGATVPAGAEFVAIVAGQTRHLCCAGCKAIAELIDGQGLHAYYDARASLPAQSVATAESDRDERLYDRPEVQQAFVRSSENGIAEVELVLEGITCSACLWLNERRLQAVSGVLRVEVNYSTLRVRVRWRTENVLLSEILGAVRSLGYRAFPSTSQAAEASQRREYRDLLWRMAVAGLGMMQVMMYALPAYIAQDGAMTGDIDRLLRWASLVLTLPVMLYSCAPFLRGAWRDVRNRALGMDVPVALGLIVAFLASAFNTMRGAGEVYFDSVTMFAFLLLLARFVELDARQKAARALDYISRALPLSARNLPNYPTDEAEESIPAISLARGDVVAVRPGETIPADGVILQGETQVDESLLSGESRPVHRVQGADVIAGAINRLSPILVRVERTGEHTRASHIARLMARAGSERPRIARITDRIAARFVLAVLLIAIGTAVGWYFVDPSKSLWTFIAVLVVTCPCALSLATPAVIAIATAELARRGVVVTRSHAIEALACADHFAFDKTGTLTEGRLSLARVVPWAEISERSCVDLAAALEAHSEHPIGRAMAALGESVRASEIRNLPGRGIEGWIDGMHYRLGSESFAGAGPHAHPVGADMGLTRVWLADDQRTLACFEFSDRLREGAVAALHALRQSGARVLLLSGDRASAVQVLAAALGITSCKADMSPEDKLDYVRALQGKEARVVMIGDGVNDSPVLAQADLSIAMGSGAVLSQAHADIVITSNSLLALRDGVKFSRRAMRIVRQNLIWALGYNLLAIPLAVSGLLTPWLAGVGMAISSMLVVMNSLRLMSPRGAEKSAVSISAPAASFG